MTPSAGTARRRDRSYGPVVLLGLAAAALTAVAATRTWATATGRAAGISVTGSTAGAEAAPLSAALALVCLAAWGVVLVTRGRVRRAVAVAGALAAAGVLVAQVAAYSTAQDLAIEAMMGQAAGDAVAARLTVWYFLTAAGAVLALTTFSVAVVRSPRWPAMGSRYDAPAERRETGTGDDDMWRALDEGRDPTS